jgi:hypothetical protein
MSAVVSTRVRKTPRTSSQWRVSDATLDAGVKLVRNTSQTSTKLTTPPHDQGYGVPTGTKLNGVLGVTFFHYLFPLSRSISSIQTSVILKAVQKPRIRYARIAHCTMHWLYRHTSVHVNSCKWIDHVSHVGHFLKLRPSYTTGRVVFTFVCVE